MRTFSLSLLLLLSTLPGLSQEGFSLEGTVGSGTNRSPQVFVLWLEGKTHFNDFLSAGLGLGLWQSGYKDTWIETYDDLTATHFRLSDNQTLPALSLSVRGDWPLFNLGIKPLRLFLEPQIIGMPFTGRTVKLEENYLLSLDPNANPPTYTPRALNPTFDGDYPISGKPQLGWGVRTGLAFQLNAHVDYFLSGSYTSLDPFESMKGTVLNARERGVTINLDGYRPQRPLFFVNLGFAYRFQQP